MPLQKSFSERVGTATNRQPWHRSHSHPVSSTTLRPRPLQPVSEVTKKKLSKFQYQPRPDESTGEDADLAAATPLTRLNWRDLVEPDAPAEDETNTSPNDKIMWNNKQDSLYVSALSPMMARKRKRARSSSPISSPSADKPETPAIDVGMLKEALKSSRADPTLELWDRYSLNGPENAVSPAGAVNPVLEQLMISSPKPLKDISAPRTEGNLRRAMSCGLVWPKRRKMSKVGSQGEQRELEAASKSSLVTALLDTATYNLPTESPQHNASPSPKKRRPRQTNSSSPCRAASGGGAENIAYSDYGDDDFDDDTFMELEATIQIADPPKSSTTVTQTGRESSETGRLSRAEIDEFKDLDDSIFDQANGLANNSDPPKLKLDLLRGGPTAPESKNNVQGDPSDEFEDDFDGDIDFDAVELAATQSVQQRPRSASTSTTKRYLVTTVLEGEYVDQHGQARPEKVLVIQADGSKIVRTVQLRGSWFDTPAHAESYVHVIGAFSAKGQCIVDDAQNLLILHPDQLVSATVVADSFSCTRRAVLQDRVKATVEASPPLVYGTMLHEIFQEALLANKWDLDFLAQVIERIAEKHVEDLYTIKVGMATAIEHLQSKMTELKYWATAFVSSVPKADAIIEDRNGKSANVAITKLLDVEEHVWSPMYGLKGNIDATVEAVMLDGKQRRTVTVPFEVKTGRFVSSSHMAQTALYTLLLSDRYDIDIVCGILYYMETSKTMRIPAVRHELRHMIMQRNQLACYIRERSVQLPPMLKNKQLCGRCYAKASCFTYHRLADDGDGESSGMHEKFDELVKHLTPTHQEFFVKWENLLTKEEKDNQKMKRELWTMTSVEREKKSRCFADVVIEEGSASVDSLNPRINRYHYTFIKRIHQPGFSFLESELSVGEPIVVSDEEGHFALAIGYVTSVRKQRISVAVDRRLHNARIRQPGFDEADNQVFASIMEVAHKGASTDQTQGKIKEPPVRYRLDKDEFSNGMATVRNNLLQLMANEVPAAAQMRRLVVDLAPPRFKAVPSQYTIADRESLNIDQQKAIEKVMSAQDYALVLGMPGTGKTTTIAHIIRALTSQGKSVLLTSHTHTAVDNILIKLKSAKIPILRLGAPAKVHPEVKDFVHLAGEPKKTFEAIKEAWHGTPIVATTCLGINHPVFLERTFDYCIVDEASQITLPICAGPIRMASSFVLVGDHNQLPPVVRNEEAREGGLDVSLFKLLSDTHPESVVNLAHQYRMCEDIMTLSNTLIYEGKLRCGYDALRHRKLHVPSLGALRHVHYDAASLSGPGTPRSICTGPAPSRCWLYDLVDSEARVRFVNTDTIRPMVREEAQGKRIVNSAEVRIVAQLVESLLAVGVPTGEVGVMTHYRAQLVLLKDRLRGHASVEMHTTDRFQGRDKEVIVLSLVRSNEACNIGDLLKDWRRINVAFTRAKTKLLVVGSKSTLKHGREDNMLSRFIALMESRDWVYNLPADAINNHHFEELCTPATAATQRISPAKKSPKKAAATQWGKENRRPSPRKARIGEKPLLKGKLITRDILNEMTNGAYQDI
ncbi:DNA replication factor dna2 domain-containing protein [Hirsutella rhossiliensis]|uniref:DNA replication ATP-dependent helicase/nuclease n=1 Tax=Hirsutella rhossiliensis TaxID=111463 RepID=A0A9P8SF64_9HYPO|nr:DNA replication factor dna2 domain-containing protein [Hirsutella rhossiliensis]KAH0958701.1 DNA replication factor dna2 domain-containing protein [Hirsutella rhossiliensis]